MATAGRRDVQQKTKRISIWGWLFDFTLGNIFRLIWWSLAAVMISIVIEWVGMIWFWEPEHSQHVLELEMSYLSAYNKNMITGWYPSDLGVNFKAAADTAVSWLHLRELSEYLADGVVGGGTQIAIHGINATVNTLFIFAVRSAICVSAVSGFVLVGLVAFIDGLVERDIRKACGGIESALLYHRAKRFLGPMLFLSFGGYLTAPVSIHPTLVFLPVMGLFAVALFIAAKTFKKFL